MRDLPKTTRVPSVDCIKCGSELSAATAVGNSEGPVPGSASVCGYCGNVAIFTEECKLRPVTPEEMADLETNDEFRIAMTAIAEMAEKHKFDNNWRTKWRRN